MHVCPELRVISNPPYASEEFSKVQLFVLLCAPANLTHSDSDELNLLKAAT